MSFLWEKSQTWRWLVTKTRDSKPFFLTFATVCGVIPGIIGYCVMQVTSSSNPELEAKLRQSARPELTVIHIRFSSNFSSAVKSVFHIFGIGDIELICINREPCDGYWCRIRYLIAGMFKVKVYFRIGRVCFSEIRVRVIVKWTILMILGLFTNPNLP